MNVKTRIWMLPLVAAVLFIIGIAVIYGMSTRTSAALNEIGDIDYPFLEAGNEMANRLDSYTSSLEAAAIEGEKKRVAEASEHLKRARAALEKMQALEGKAEVAKALATRLDAYQSAGSAAVAVALGEKAGDQRVVGEAMRAAQKAMMGELSQVREKARSELTDGIASAKSGVRRSTLAIMICAVVIIGGLMVGSWIVIASCWRQFGGEPRFAASMARAVAAGDLTVPIRLEKGDDQSRMAYLY